MLNSARGCLLVVQSRGVIPGECLSEEHMGRGFAFLSLPVRSQRLEGEKSVPPPDCGLIINHP